MAMLNITQQDKVRSPLDIYLQRMHVALEALTKDVEIFQQLVAIFEPMVDTKVVR